MVLAPELEIGYLNLSGNGTQPSAPGGDTQGKTDSDFYTAFRARIGVDVNHYLLFLTGGAIGVNYTNQIADHCTIAPCGGGTIDANFNGYTWGYTVGAGVEHMIQQNWSVKLEYFYLGLAEQNFRGTTNLGNTYGWTGQSYGSVIRGGVSYYFSWWVI